MSDEDLEVLITLDDPWYGPDEDTFHHLQPDTEWPGSMKAQVAFHVHQEDYRHEMLFAFK